MPTTEAMLVAAAVVAAVGVGLGTQLSSVDSLKKCDLEVVFKSFTMNETKTYEAKRIDKGPWMLVNLSFSIRNGSTGETISGNFTGPLNTTGMMGAPSVIYEDHSPPADELNVGDRLIMNATGPWGLTVLQDG